VLEEYHEGSSGSMELAACLEIVIEAFEKRHVIVRKLCCDDDSSVRADCQWNKADWMINNNSTEAPMVPKKAGKNMDGRTEKARGQWQTTGAYT
jgi:hypothetical protein